jgi:hypothetical protein
MYKQSNTGFPTPTANLAINRSRLKVYGKNSEAPTYYLQKGQEFQIELFNPTKDTILAKISLNGKPIAQGGLVLKPAQRVFLERYIDVARKFKFDTYEVANTSESRKAIEDNGDFKVEFYREKVIVPNYNSTPIWINNIPQQKFYDTYDTYDINCFVNQTNGTIDLNNRVSPSSFNSISTNSVSTYSSNSAQGSMNFMDQSTLRSAEPKKDLRPRSFAKKSIETGRVEMGNNSEQTLTTVYMNWESFPFHTIAYKMLPESQKINTVNDINVVRYCTNCGTKTKPTFKFCPSCGTKA